MARIFCDFCGSMDEEENMTNIADYDGPEEIDMRIKFMCTLCAEKYAQTYIHNSKPLEWDK